MISLQITFLPACHELVLLISYWVCVTNISQLVVSQNTLFHQRTGGEFPKKYQPCIDIIVFQNLKRSMSHSSRKTSLTTEAKLCVRLSQAVQAVYLKAISSKMTPNLLAVKEWPKCIYTYDLMPFRSVEGLGRKASPHSLMQRYGRIVFGLS